MLEQIRLGGIDAVRQEWFPSLNYVVQYVHAQALHGCKVKCILRSQPLLVTDLNRFTHPAGLSHAGLMKTQGQPFFRRIPIPIFL